jgi:hypothetical protein
LRALPFSVLRDTCLSLGRAKQEYPDGRETDGQESHIQ